MYSLNVPLPGRVPALVADVAADLRTAGAVGLGAAGAVGADPDRGASASTLDDSHLVAKRLPDGDYHHLANRAREALRGVSPFELRLTAVDYFAEAPSGTSPVVYLAVDSPGLFRLHDRLADCFEPVTGVEGAEYTPHVTVARGGTAAAAEAVAGPIDPVRWTADALEVWDARDGEPAMRLPLSA